MRRCCKNAVDARIGRIFRAFQNRYSRMPTVPALRPVGDDLLHLRVVRINGLDQPESAGMRGTHLQGVAGVIAIERIGRDQ